MYVVYIAIDGNYIPSGVMKRPENLLPGEIIMLPEFGVQGLSYIPYVVNGKTLVDGMTVLEYSRMEV